MSLGRTNELPEAAAETCLKVRCLSYVGNWGNGGHPRFSRLGWVIGGEFALYYFFATFINELADCMFVVPTTTEGGWRCKVFSVALEVAQLGALAPAAVFNHNPCLTYTAPLGTSIAVIRDLIVPWGYVVWSLIFACLPLAVCGALLLAIPWLLGHTIGVCGICCTAIAARTDGDVDEFSARTLAITGAAEAWLEKITKQGLNSFMFLSFLPMLCAGCFLGLLVVVGQGSKQGFMQVVTAIVLLADVLFKVGATVLTETHEYLLHKRVTRALAAQQMVEQQMAEQRPAEQHKVVGAAQPVGTSVDV